MSSPDLVRHLAPSHGGSVVATAKFESEVTIWDIQALRALISFETILDFGGQRLAVDRHGKRCVAAAYNRYGVACYSTLDGSILWERRDVRRTQYLAASPIGDAVFCAGESRPCVVLDLQSGEILETLRGVLNVVESPFDRVRFLDKGRPEVRWIDSDRIIPLERETFAFLDVAFGPNQLCTTESGGPTRCQDLNTGEELWRYAPPPGVHVLHVGFSPRQRCFLGVQWPHENGGPKQLLKLEHKPEVVATIGEPATCAFCGDADLLLTSDGELFDTATGEIRDRLPFPW